MNNISSRKRYEQSILEAKELCEKKLAPIAEEYATEVRNARSVFEHSIVPYKQPYINQSKEYINKNICAGNSNFLGVIKTAYATYRLNISRLENTYKETLIRAKEKYDNGKEKILDIYMTMCVDALEIKLSIDCNRRLITYNLFKRTGAHV